MALVVWLVCGLFSMVGAYCYSELGCMIKKAGGDYSYILDTFGPFVAFIRLWAECLIVRPCTIAIVGLTFATYATKPFFPECNPPDEAIRCLAAVCICKLVPGRRMRVFLLPNLCQILHLTSMDVHG
jgi:amino acid transporter